MPAVSLFFLKHFGARRYKLSRNPTNAVDIPLQKNAQTSDILHLIQERGMDSLKYMSELWDPNNKPIQAERKGRQESWFLTSHLNSAPSGCTFAALDVLILAICNMDDLEEESLMDSILGFGYHKHTL